jgi:hypothetical protein
MLDEFHVHPNLMGAACLQLQVKKAGTVVSLQGLKMGDRVLSRLTPNRHAVPGGRMPANGRIHHPFFTQEPLHDSQVFPAQFPSSQLSYQASIGFSRLGYH